MSWPHAILFDVDGTLAETEECHRAAFNAAFAAHGLDWHWDRELYRELLRVAGGAERMRHFAGVRADGIDLAVLHADKNARYRRLVENGVALRPGIGALIGHARTQGIRLGIATTTSRGNVEALIAGSMPAGARGWFDVLACAEDAADKKPDPAIYRFALEAMGIDAAEALAVEDSTNGLDAAHAAGIACLVTPSFYCRCEAPERAALVLDDLAAIPPEDLLEMVRARI